MGFRNWSHYTESLKEVKIQKLLRSSPAVSKSWNLWLRQQLPPLKDQTSQCLNEWKLWAFVCVSLVWIFNENFNFSSRLFRCTWGYFSLLWHQIRSFKFNWCKHEFGFGHGPIKKYQLSYFINHRHHCRGKMTLVWSSKTFITVSTQCQIWLGCIC